jgi:hypothetical protein
MGKDNYVISSYLVMDNPVVFDEIPPYANSYQAYMNSRYDEFVKPNGKYADNDGLIFRNLSESGYGSDIYVVRSKEQIIPVEQWKNEKESISILPRSVKDDALSKGNPVPPEVLKDYPELKKQSKPVAIAWDKLDKLAREEILQGGGMQLNMSGMKWDELDEWIQETLRDSINRRSNDRARLEPKTTKDTTQPYFTELMAIHESRSPHSRVADEGMEHSLIVDPDDPRVKQWIKDPGRMDVRGVDTPRKRKVKRKASTRKDAPTKMKGIRR